MQTALRLGMIQLPFVLACALASSMRCRGARMARYWLDLRRRRNRDDRSVRIIRIRASIVVPLGPGATH